jgi:hypothetical protein
MRQRKLKAVSPVWAEKILVQREQETLSITGWGCHFLPLPTAELNSREVNQLDILRRFRSSAARQAAKKHADGSAGVYRFADATDDEKLISFCEEFGPVWGKVSSVHWEKQSLTWTVTVQQDMDDLRREQAKFASAVRLIQELNKKNGQTDYMAILEAMAGVGIDKENLSLAHLGWVYRTGKPHLDQVLPVANWVGCSVLNEYPPRLSAVEREALELPDVQREGIRNAIYYPLRLDYLAQREIGVCLHCGSHFSVYRHGAQCCSDPCRRTLRNQRYWTENHERINKKRRKQRKRGK